MKRTGGAWLAALALWLACAPVGADKGVDPEPPLTPAEALKRMEGEWTVLSLKEEGKDLRREMDVEAVVFRKGSMVVKGKGRREGHAVRFDPKAPSHIDILTADGKGPPGPGIFKFEKGKLLMAFAPVGKPRPAKFDDPDATIFVLRRAGAKE
jgi:uncharacterized protein (TIGR03067 family)